MNWKQLLNVLASALVMGAVSGVAQHYSNPGAAGAGGLVGSVIAGAAISVVQHLRPSPVDGGGSN